MKKFLRRILVVIYKPILKIFRGRGLYKIWPFGIMVDWINNTLKSLPRADSIKFKGMTVFLDSNDNQGLAFWKENELLKGEISVYENYVHRGDTVLDIGANIGLLTLLFAKLVGPEGKVFSFEPAPENIEILNKNVVVNNLKNVIIIPKAVSDKDGSENLFLSDYNVGDHRIYNPQQKIAGLPSGNEYERLSKWTERPSIKVDIVALDNFSEIAGKKIDFIKIDVQGAEAGVIPGMSRILDNNQSLKIAFEFWPAGIAMFGGNPKNTLIFIQNKGFHFFEIDEQKGLDNNEISIGTLLDKYTVGNNKTAYLLATKIR